MCCWVLVPLPPPSFFIVAPSPTFILLSVFPNTLPPLILSFFSPSIALLSLSLRWITAGFRSLLAAGGNPINSSRDSYHETITLIPPFLGRVWNLRPPPSPLRIFATNNQLNFTPPRSLYAQRGSIPSYFRHYLPVISSIALLSIFLGCNFGIRIVVLAATSTQFPRGGRTPPPSGSAQSSSCPASIYAALIVSFFS